MAITKNPGRQWALVAKVPFGFADFAGNSGVALEAVDLPVGASLTSASLTITEVFDSATSDAIDIAGAGASLAATDAQVLGTTEDTSIDSTALAVQTAVTLEWTGVGAVPTTGAGFALIGYVIDGRANEVQPV